MNGLDCPICYYPMTDLCHRPIVLSCGHVLCAGCVSSCCLSFCPLCREPIAFTTRCFLLESLLARPSPPQAGPFPGALIAGWSGLCVIARLLLLGFKRFVTLMFCALVCNWLELAQWHFVVAAAAIGIWGWTHGLADGVVTTAALFGAVRFYTWTVPNACS
jgi:hypothetical protein